MHEQLTAMYCLTRIPLQENGLRMYNTRLLNVFKRWSSTNNELHYGIWYWSPLALEWTLFSPLNPLYSLMGVGVTGPPLSTNWSGRVLQAISSVMLGRYIQAVSHFVGLLVWSGCGQLQHDSNSLTLLGWVAYMSHRSFTAIKSWNVLRSLTQLFNDIKDSWIYSVRRYCLMGIGIPILNLRLSGHSISP